MKEFFAETTKINREKDKQTKFYNFDNVCQICGFMRTDRRHTKKCSKIMQQRSV